jgi:hypothetical protein
VSTGFHVSVQGQLAQVLDHVQVALLGRPHKRKVVARCRLVVLAWLGLATQAPHRGQVAGTRGLQHVHDNQMQCACFVSLSCTTSHLH